LGVVSGFKIDAPVGESRISELTKIHVAQASGFAGLKIPVRDDDPLGIVISLAEILACEFRNLRNQTPVTAANPLGQAVAVRSIETALLGVAPDCGENDGESLRLSASCDSPLQRCEP